MGNIRDSAEGRGPSDGPKLGIATGMPEIKPDSVTSPYTRPKKCHANVYTSKRHLSSDLER